MKRATMLTAAAFALLACCTAGCGGDDKSSGPNDDAFSSRAYKGHAGDLDMNHLVAVYDAAVGTRVDDCQSCHQGGDVTAGGRTRYKSACDYCHFIPFPVEGAEGVPATYEQTLNAFGLAYKQAGRSTDAIEAIADLDSDGDGFTNADEIADRRYPGDATSQPGQPRASLLYYNVSQLQAMPSHEQFLLANASKQEFDTYATYTGVTIKALLEEIGIDLTQIAGISVISADGFIKDYDVSQIVAPYATGVYHAGLSTGDLGADCGFVEYPSVVPEGLTDGGAIPGEQWLMLAYQRDGGPMDVSYLDPVSGKIEGEGPLRSVVPQEPPGAPDRGSTYSPSGCDDGHDYDENASHNAGDMVRGVVAIRINPMPEGVEEFDAMNGGWAYVDSGQLIVYGYGIE